MKNTITLLLNALIISSVNFNLKANDLQIDPIHYPERYSLDRPIIHSRSDTLNNNNGFVFKMKGYTKPDNKAFTMKAASTPGLTYTAKLRLLAESNINRCVKNAYKTGIDINNDQKTYEGSHFSKVRMLVGPMSPERNFHNKFRDPQPLFRTLVDPMSRQSNFHNIFRDTQPLIIWKSN